MGFDRQDYWSGVPLPSPGVTKMGSKRKVTVCVASSGKQIGYPQPLSNQRKIVMGSQGGKKVTSLTITSVFSSCLTILINNSSSTHMPKSIRSPEDGFKWFEVKYGPNAEKAMAPHFSTFAWKIPWTEEPGGL